MAYSVGGSGVQDALATGVAITTANLPPSVSRPNTGGGAGPGPATHFVVVGPSSATTGTSFTFEVIARDASNNLATGYAGTVHFTSTDGAASLPANSTLSGGIGMFTATLNTIGTWTITATDTVTGSINGTTSPIAAIGATTHFVVSAPGTETAGNPITVTVTAKDSAGNTTPAYTGTVHFTSSDGAAVLPANTTLTAGVGTFSATLKTAGSQTVTATDTVTGTITGTSGAIAVSAAAASTLSVSAPGTASIGVAISITVTALDPYGNTATGYAGTVHFTSTDGAAVLPSNSTLTSGTGTFSATLNTAGNQTITATDTVTGSITGTSGTIVASVVVFPPQVSGTNATIAADFVTPQYWAAGASQASFSAWLTAIGGTLSRPSTATYISSGVVQTAAANVARFPASQGIRLTGSATNLMLQSAFGTAGANWSGPGGGGSIAPGVSGPDGTTNASLVTFTSGNGAVFQPLTFTAGTTYTLSMFLEPGTLSAPYLTASDSGTVSHVTAIFDLTGASGTVASQTSVLGATLVSTSLTSLAGGWYLASMTFTLTGAAGNYFYWGPANAATGNTFNTNGIPNGTPGGTINAWGVQVTATAFQCDYIPTTTVTVTQAADNLQFPFTQTTYSALVGSNGLLFDGLGNQRILSDSTNSGLQTNTATAFLANNGGSNVSGPTVTSVFNPHKNMIAGNTTNVWIATDGLTPLTGAQAINNGVPTTMNFGQAFNGTVPCPGNYAQLAIWNGIVASTSEMQRLTTISGTYTPSLTFTDPRNVSFVPALG